jgi:hypothetical protein
MYVWYILAEGPGLLDWGKRMKQKLVLTQQQQDLCIRCDLIQVLELYFEQMLRANLIQKNQKSCIQNCRQSKPMYVNSVFDQLFGNHYKTK